MKNFTFIISSLFVGSVAFSQPVIQANQYNASVGEALTIHRSNYMNPGASGANVIWDLSALTDNSSEVISYTAANPSFPGSNITGNFQGGVSANFIFDNAGQQYRAITAGSTVIDYSNPQTSLKFPITYNTSFNDDFYATFLVV